MGENGQRRHFLRQMTLAMLLMAFGRPLGAVHAALRAERGTPATGCLTLRNLHTGETLAVRPEEAGAESVQAQIDRLLRCHYTDEVHTIDRQLLASLFRLHARIGNGTEMEIISGYRSPTYNDILRQKSRGVARNSLHLLGQAIDLRMPGIALDRLRRQAVDLHRGGIGYYPTSGFIHLDVGAPRTWQGV